MHITPLWGTFPAKTTHPAPDSREIQGSLLPYTINPAALLGDDNTGQHLVSGQAELHSWYCSIDSGGKARLVCRHT